MEDTKFNLEKALAGDPVETIYGQEVTELCILRTPLTNGVQVLAVIGGDLEQYDTQGVHWSPPSEYGEGQYCTEDCDLTLRMKKKVHVLHLVIHKNGGIDNFNLESNAKEYAIMEDATYKRIEFTL